MQNLFFLSEAFMKKSVLCCSKTTSRSLKKVMQPQALSNRIMTFQQEVTILSHTTPSKAVISPLLPLNSCAVVIEKAFCGMKIKMKGRYSPSFKIKLTLHMKLID